MVSLLLEDTDSIFASMPPVLGGCHLKMLTYLAYSLVYTI